VNPELPSSAVDRDLAEQRWLLERARTALGRGDGAAALDSLEEHQRRYPEGQLTEEREVLEIEASLALGRSSEAKLRGAEFERRHPGSLLLPAVESTLRSLP
jgi:outer membrane protein assembly factor BamD (BamD/ComL family)